MQSQYFKPSTTVYIRYIDKVQKKAIKVDEAFLVSSYKLSSFAATKETLSTDEKKKHFRVFGKFSSQVDSNQIEFHEPVSSPFIETEGKEWWQVHSQKSQNSFLWSKNRVSLFYLWENLAALWEIVSLKNCPLHCLLTGRQREWNNSSRIVILAKRKLSCSYIYLSNFNYFAKVSYILSN